MTGLILTGGKSSRMGADKALLKVGKLSLLELQIERLKKLKCSILISGPSDRGYEKFGQVVEDKREGGGPLAGLQAGFLASKEEFVIVVAVDLPNVTTEFLSWLVEELGDADAICPRSEHGLEPLCAVYRRESCLPIVKRRLQNGKLSLQGFMEELQAQDALRVVEPDEWEGMGEDLLENWNQP